MSAPKVIIIEIQTKTYQQQTQQQQSQNNNNHTQLPHHTTPHHIRESGTLALMIAQNCTSIFIHSCSERFEMFVSSQWDSVLEASRVCGDKAALARRRRTHRSDGNIRRVDWVVHLGELSSARQALDGAQLAPGSRQTLEVLRSQSKRPSETIVPFPLELVNHSPRTPFNLDEYRFFRNSRFARRGAAGGPSGMTVEHLQPLLDHTKDSRMFFWVSEKLARAQVPPTCARHRQAGQAFRNRMVATEVSWQGTS